MRDLQGHYISEEEMVAMILTADAVEIELLLGAVVTQYKQLYPQWDLAALFIDEGADHNVQLDNTIALPEGTKE